MSDASTRILLEEYVQESPQPLFLTGLFRSPPRNYHTTEKVEIDIIRDDEDVAIVLQDLSVGTRHNEATKFVNKAFTPPIYDESFSISAFETIKRQPGQSPFEQPDFVANAVKEAFRDYRLIEAKIRRAIELQCAQVLQTGTNTLIDANGVAIYTLNFVPKASHFPTAAINWGSGSDVPLADLTALAGLIRADGKSMPTKLIFGTSAFASFISNAAVLKMLDNRRVTLAEVTPESRGAGATFQGYIWLGNYRFEMWTYDGFYRHPQTGVLTPYVGYNKVIMLSDNGRLDLSFGAIPMILPPDASVLGFLPPRISSPDKSIDLTTNAWVTADRKHLWVSAGTRPLAIPTAIDTYGCLTVGP